MKKTIKDYKKEIAELKRTNQNLQNELCAKRIRIGDLNYENMMLQNEIKKLKDSCLINECQFTRKCKEFDLLEAQLKATRQAISLFTGTTKVECEENLCKHI